MSRKKKKEKGKRKKEDKAGYKRLCKVEKQMKIFPFDESKKVSFVFQNPRLSFV